MTPQENLIDAVANHLLRNNDQTKEKLLVAWQAAKADQELKDASTVKPIIIDSVESGHVFLREYMHTELSEIDFLKSKLHIE